MSGPDPRQVEVLDRVTDAKTAKIWTSTQGIIVTYDAAKMVADIQLVSPSKELAKDGSYKNEKLPILADVPVLFPGGGEFKLHWPLSANDEVLILCTKQSLRAWYDQGKVGLDPIDPRNHHLAHALAIPILGRVPPTVDPDGAVVLECSLVKIGDPTTADFAALASKVDTAIGNLVLALTDPANWSGVTGGSAVATALAVAWVPTLPGPPGAHPIDPTPCERVKIT